MVYKTFSIIFYKGISEKQIENPTQENNINRFGFPWTKDGHCSNDS